MLIAISLTPPPQNVVFIPVAQAFKDPNFLKQLVGKLRATFRPQVQLRADIVSTSKIDSTKRAVKILGRPPLAETNGTLVWTLEETDVSRLTEYLKVAKTDLIARPRIVVKDSLQGSMFAGNSVTVDGTNIGAGMDFRVLPKQKEKVMDLTLGFSWTESTTDTNNSTAGVSIVTNTAFAVRSQIERGRRLLVVSETTSEKQPVLIFVWSISSNRPE
jgi:hypothetical protein